MSLPDKFNITFSLQEQLENELSQQATLDVPKVVLSLIICVFGLLGNLFAIFVILVLKEYKKSVTHWYVLQLAIADSIFLLTLPFKVNEDFSQGWTYPEWMCKAKETILFLNYYASILFLVVMSLDRYIAVCHTFSYSIQKVRNRTSAFLITIAVWSVALLVCIPIMLYSTKRGIAPYCDCSYEFPNPRNYTAECLAEKFESPLLIENCIRIIKLEQAENGEEYCTTKISDSFATFPPISFNLENSTFDFSLLGIGAMPTIASPANNLADGLPGFPGNFSFAPLLPAATNTPASEVEETNSFLGDFDFDDLINILLSNQGISAPNVSSLPTSESAGSGSGFDAIPEQGSGSGSSGFSRLENGIIHDACHYWNHPFGWVFFLIFNFSIMFVLPFLVMVVCYGLIIHRLSTTKMRSTSTASYNKSVRNGTSQKKKSSSRSDIERKRVTVMCAALVSCFLVCWLPFHAFHLAKLVGINSNSKDYCDSLISIGALLAYLNSALNPYLYSFLGTNFSRRMKLLKQSSGIQQLVSFRPKLNNDATNLSRSKDSDKGNNKAHGSRNRGDQSFDKISPQRPTLITRIPKDNESSQSPSLQTADLDYDTKRMAYNDQTGISRYSTLSEDLLSKQ